MLEYARWKYLLVGVVLLLAVLLALPNVFGEDPAIQLARKDRAAVSAQALSEVTDFLKTEQLAYNSVYLDKDRLMLRFASVSQQLQARDAVNQRFASDYVSALSFAPRTPEWLRKLGLRPMSLGLDLRGGLYLLYQVDMSSSIKQLLDGYAQDMRRALTQAKIPFSDVATLALDDATTPNAVRVTLEAGVTVEAARTVLLKVFPDITFSAVDVAQGTALQLVLNDAQIRQRQDYALQQNILTLRNRVNELGVAEPIVQRQGIDRINVQLPGVQNSAEVKDILGKVATLEFRMEDERHNAFEAEQSGRAPFGTKLYQYEQRPVLLKRDVIATGDQLTNAVSANTQDGPGVSVRLDARAGEKMLKTTQANLGKRMGVVFIEKRRETVTIGNEKITRDVTDEKVINLATIRGVFSNNFQITGMSAGGARELALLLRAGSLVTPIYPIGERAIGPSLGQENIEKGVRALIVGMLAVFVFMLAYYRVFGIVANLVLLANVVLLTALLSLMGAALTLPGIAGIILTVGMAVDANVLIYERIREELRNGVSTQAAIRAGFDKAFAAIFDSNVTTLIAGVVLWIFGTGPIRGFAVVLTLGILTSMFTSIMGSRALITLMYGGTRRVARPAIG
jgi:preprotein translocase subunit SecD